MLLSNVTAHGSACTVLLSLKISVLPDPKSPLKVFPVDSRSMTCPAPVPYPSGDPKEVLALPLLVDAFVKVQQAIRVVEGGKRPAQQGSEITGVRASRRQIAAFDWVLSSLSDAESVARKLAESQQVSYRTRTHAPSTL